MTAVSVLTGKKHGNRSRRTNPWPITQVIDDAALLASFSTWQRSRAFSPSTVRRRATSLHSLSTFIAPVTLTNASTTLIEEWLATLRSARTKHAYRSDVRVFYTWATRRDLIGRDPSARTDSVKVPRSLPHPVDATLIPGLLSAAHDPDTKLMLALAALAGLRRSEIAKLSTDDLSLHARPPLLIVRAGKGARDRIIPLHPWLHTLLAEPRPQGRLFELVPSSVGRRISTHLERCGVRASAHALRHSFATELARASCGDVLLVQSLMGHQSATTTAGYISFQGEGAGSVGAMYHREA